MNPHQLSVKEARRLILECQGFLKPNPFGKGKHGTEKAITALSYLQIDTISVVSRAHHHTLWARVPGYSPKMLFDLQAKDKKIFEYWSHAAAFLPIEDYRFSLPRKAAHASGRRHWFDSDKKVKQYVFDRIKAEGPLMSKDFEHGAAKAGVWYEFKPAKVALGQLFIEGKLMIAERRGFQKVFDLPERVLPEETDTSMPSEKEMARHLILRAIESHGLVREKAVFYQRKGMGPVIRNTVRQLLESGEIVEIAVSGLPGELFYTNQKTLARLPSRIGKKMLHVLCPFDNMLIQRQRAIDFFQFDYKIECYVPAPKRIKGYFSLPVLWGDRFIGQFDAKADRKKKVFIIKQFHLEDWVKDCDEFLPALAEKLRDYAHFNGCESIEIDEIVPKDFKQKLVEVLKKSVYTN